MTISNVQSSGPPQVEVQVVSKRRVFTKEYKLEILEKADHCLISGGVGKLLRQEGLYSSQLTSWRRDRRDGTLQALGRRRGPKAKKTTEQLEIERLQCENKRLRKKLDHAEKIIDVQKKLSEVLGIPLEENVDATDRD